LVVPKKFDWLVSEYENVIYPDDPDWDDLNNGWPAYWRRYAFADIRDTYEVGSTEHVLDIEPQRVRHAMLVIHEMNDGGRAKMNLIHVYAETFEVSGSEGGTETEGTGEGALSGYIIKHLLTEYFGLDEALFTMTDEGRVFHQLDTTKSPYLQVFQDILSQTGCALYFGLDERVEHRFDPFYPLGVLDDVAITWTPENARNVEMTLPDENNVSQVILRSRDETGEGLSYEVRYPPTPLPVGSVLTVENVVLGSVTDALLMAHRVFRRRNGPATAVVTPVGPAEWVRPGHRCVIDWVLDTEGTLISDRNFVVTHVQFQIELGNAAKGKPKNWTTSIGLEELVF
jgi:hypothetical protein